MLQMDLTGKIAVVTGAGGQLGRVIARTLADCGADVAVHYRSSDAVARQVAEDIRAMGHRALAVQADITDLASVLCMRDTIAGELGHPDIVVNSAVVQIEWKNVLEQAVEDYDSQYQSCVVHNVLMAKAFLPAMMEKKEGRFIGINTECAMLSDPGSSAYVSGKRGMDGVLRCLAKEVGEYGITVNQVAPGWTISDNDRKNHTEVSESYNARTPLGRRGTDQEIANAVAFLASGLASNITGVYLPVCGGRVMPGI